MMTNQDDIRAKPGADMGDSSDKEDTENHDEDSHEEPQQTHGRSIKRHDESGEKCWKLMTQNNQNTHRRKQELEIYKMYLYAYLRI